MSRPTQEAPPNKSLCLYRTFTVCGQTFQNVPVRKLVALGRPYNPADAETTAVWALSLSIATTREIDNFLSFPPGTKMFQFPGLAPAMRVPGRQPGGLSHSEIRGSEVICTYPRLFAACHVLHRL